MHCEEEPCLLLELAPLLLQRRIEVQLASHAGLGGNAETAASLTHQSITSVNCDHNSCACFEESAVVSLIDTAGQLAGVCSTCRAKGSHLQRCLPSSQHRAEFGRGCAGEPHACSAAGPAALSPSLPQPAGDQQGSLNEQWGLDACRFWQSSLAQVMEELLQNLTSATETSTLRVTLLCIIAKHNVGAYITDLQRGQQADLFICRLGVACAAAMGLLTLIMPLQANPACQRCLQHQQEA